jgi:hypothetical protein
MTTLLWGFQTPWLLLTLLGLIVPIAIHLLSKSKGKKILFGDIKLLNKTKQVKMTQIRLVDPLLLLLRISLLLIACLLIAKFYFINQKVEKDTVILVTPDWLNYASSAQKNDLLKQGVNLVNKGSESSKNYGKQALETNVTSENNTLISWSSSQNGAVYLLAKQYSTISNRKRLSPDDIINGANAQLLGSSAQVKNNLWLLVESMTNTFSSDTQFIVYSTNKIDQFNGGKIALSGNVTWRIKPIKPTISLEDFTKQQTLNVNIVGQNDIGQNNTGQSYTEQKNTDQQREHLSKALMLIKQYSMENMTVKSFPTMSAYLKELTPEEKAKQKPSQETLPANLNNSANWLVFLPELAVSAEVKIKILEEIKAGSQVFIVGESASFFSNIELLNGFSPLTLPSLTFLPEDVFSYKKLAEGALYQVNTSKSYWHYVLLQPYFPQILQSLLLHRQMSTFNEMNGRLTNEQITTPLYSSYENENENAEEGNNKTAFSTDNFSQLVDENKTTEQRENAQKQNRHLWLMLLFILWALERLLSEYGHRKAVKRGDIDTTEVRADLND